MDENDDNSDYHYNDNECEMNVC